MKRPCLGGCGAVIERGSRCRRCEAERRGTSAEQQRYRRAVLAITGGRCFVCGSRDRVEAHHLEALEDGGSKEGLGVPLCRRHHVQMHDRAS